MTSNQKIVLDNRPLKEANASNFKLVSETLPALQEGHVLVKHHYLSLDPYMRGRMNDSKSYAASQAIGEVMIGGTVGEVVESKHAKYAVGDKVVGMGGWQQFSIADGNAVGALRKVLSGPCRCRHISAQSACRASRLGMACSKFASQTQARRWW